MDVAINYYDLLQLNFNAPEGLISAAYKYWAKVYHPDITEYDKDFAQKQMCLLNDAKDTLLNQEKRRLYDQELKIKFGSSYSNNQSNGTDPIIDFLNQHGLKFYDKRKYGGALWVLGDWNTGELLKPIKGVKFYFSKNGGRTTSYRSAWWCK